MNTSELYEQRMLVFIETSPQSNEYRQVHLNKEQFKKVSDDICVSVKPADRHGIEEVEIEESDETYFLPTELRSINI